MGYGYLQNRFLTYDGVRIPFENNFFDIVISHGVLDSMRFSLAKKIIKEIYRVVKKYAFISLISGDNHRFYRDFDGEEIVETQHEKGTVQTYYNLCKIKELIKETGFKIKWIRLITEEGLNHKYRWGRYYIVLEKGD